MTTDTFGIPPAEPDIAAEIAAARQRRADRQAAQILQGRARALLREAPPGATAEVLAECANKLYGPLPETRCRDCGNCEGCAAALRRRTVLTMAEELRSDAGERIPVETYLRAYAEDHGLVVDCGDAPASEAAPTPEAPQPLTAQQAPEMRACDCGCGLAVPRPRMGRPPRFIAGHSPTARKAAEARHRSTSRRKGAKTT